MLTIIIFIVISVFTPDYVRRCPNKPCPAPGISSQLKRGQP